MEKRSIGPVTGSAALGAAIGTIIVWVFTLNGIDVPEGVQGAIIVLCTIAGGWLVPPGTGKRKA